MTGPAQAAARPAGPADGPPFGEPPDALGGVLDAAGRLLHEFLLLPEQASAFAVRVDRLQYVEFGVFWLLGLIVLGSVAWFLLRYRRSSEADGAVRTERVVAPLWLELGVAGVLLAFFVGWWVVGFAQYADTADATGDAYEVYVTGKQWTWKFDYPEGRSSAGILYLPEGRRVRLLITSRDVIHSFFVPEFRIKRDAVPGRYNTVTFVPTRTGRLQGLCAEFCGSGHSRMWADVVVLEPERYEGWLETGRAPGVETPVGPPSVLAPGDAARPAVAELAERGERVASRLGCQGCHTVDGSPHLAPTWLGLYGSREVMQSGDTVTVDAGYVTESMMDPRARIVRGYGALMPSYRGQVGPSESAAIIEYMRSLATERAADQDVEGGDGGGGDG